MVSSWGLFVYTVLVLQVRPPWFDLRLMSLCWPLHGHSLLPVDAHRHRLRSRYNSPLLPL